MIDKKIRSGKKDIDAYIESLEKELQHRQTDGIEKLIFALNKVSGAIADDVITTIEWEPEYEDTKDGPKIKNPIDDQLRVLAERAGDKMLERIMMIISKIPDLQKVSDLAKQKDDDFAGVEKKPESAPGSTEAEARKHFGSRASGKRKVGEPKLKDATAQV